MIDWNKAIAEVCATIVVLAVLGVVAYIFYLFCTTAK